MKVIFSTLAFRSFKKLEKSIQIKIDQKLRFYSSQENPLQFAERLKGEKLGEWRYRIGDYRILFDVENNNLIILKVGHRKDVYK